jgi:putative oxidoreductase
MAMDRIFGNFVRGRGAAGLLIVRLVFGLGIMLHGWQKIQSPGGPMGWMGPQSPVPGFLQGLSTAAEFSGGLGIILGLLTPLAALGLTCNMLVALCMVHLPKGDPFVGGMGKGSFESAAGYLAVALLLLLAGPGVWSLDALWLSIVFPRRKMDES